MIYCQAIIGEAEGTGDAIEIGIDDDPRARFARSDTGLKVW